MDVTENPIPQTGQNPYHNSDILIEFDEQNSKRSSDDLISLGETCLTAQLSDSVVGSILSDIPSDNCLSTIDDGLFSDGEAEEEAIISYQHCRTDDEMLSIDEEALRCMKFP